MEFAKLYLKSSRALLRNAVRAPHRYLIASRSRSQVCN